MGASVQVKPLCGVYNENPLSYLVSIDGFNFLIDCGWNDHFDSSLLQPLSRVASTIDAVLLSHPDTLHLGALPYAMEQLGLSAPVYSTEPVYRMGLLTMYDQFLSRKQVSEFDLFTLDGIDSAFQRVTRLTYSQNHHLSGKGEGIVIAPHVAGHLLGGTIWKITKDGEDVIYAVDFNHRKERHLNGTVLGSFVRPAVLITGAYNALNNQPYRRQKDKEFGDILKKTLRAGGNVLLPVDTAGRILELILMLESYWADENLNYPIYFLTYVASSTIDYVKSFLEWMSDSIAKSFEQTRDNIFLLKNITLLVNKADLDNAPEGPKVVLASMASLEAGFSHDIFVDWGNNVKNLVLFTERGQWLLQKMEDTKMYLLMDLSLLQPVLPQCFPVASEWDDFGEVINPDDYVIKEEDMDQTANNVQVRCLLVYMDFEGRSDGRSIKNILSHVAPLKLVLVHGSAEATDHLKQHCLKNVCPHVYAPQIEETIDVTSDLCAYKVQLSEKLMSNVLFKKLGEYEIAWVDAEVGKTENDMLSLLPISGAPCPHKSVLVGDLKLADFKQFLSTKGIPVEFAGGALRCGEYVTVRKVGDATQKGAGSGTQQIIIEGPLCEDYYKIRDYLSSQFYLL
ncbi:hypothetical protein KIW84_012816 [Lathyrus oleraceus]|uniref:Cleavage and polyadenylation specificity factor subunit 2 n=2 Tax=Pisum sativum TaxID=3888 RepID=A0A9D5BIK1_PEA|nr:hypothetical protein KIW84_012816 [Pisum sativum]